jgi:hypothetical protein
MKEAYFEQFGKIFCDDHENFIQHLKDTKFYKEIKSKKYNNKDLKSYISNKEYNGVSYIIQLRNTPFSSPLTIYSGKSDYFTSKSEGGSTLSRLFSIDMRVIDISKNFGVIDAFKKLGIEESHEVPNVLSVSDMDGMKQFFIDANYELGVNNFDKLIEDYSEYDDEFLSKLSFICDMYSHKKFSKKMMLNDSYHYIKCDVADKEVFSYSNDASDDYFFIFERDINTKNIRVFFDFMSNVDKAKFKFSTCVVGNHPKIVHDYLENKTPCFISTDGNTKVIKNTQTYLLDDMEYIAANLAERLKVKLPSEFSIF